MLAFTDPEDHALMLSEMTQQRDDLKREHHMSEIRKLAQKHYGLRVMNIQWSVIRILRRQLEELQVNLKNVYSRQNALKDYTSKGYLVYLLEMQDFYRKAVGKLKNQLKEHDTSVKDIYVNLNARKLERAKKLRKRIGSIPKEKVIEMYEGRIERAHSEMGRLTAKNRDYRESIRHTFIVRGNFFKVYQLIRDRNEKDKKIISFHLEKAVSAYRSREDFLYKTGILKERLAVDMQKVVANNILLRRIKERDIKAEEFEMFKSQERTDCRASQIAEQIRLGVTGLERDVDAATSMHSKVVEACGLTDFVDLKERFEQAENQNFGFFCYINTLHEEMDLLNNQLNALRMDINGWDKNLTAEQRSSRMQMFTLKAKVKEVDLEVIASKQKKQEVEKELEKTKDIIQTLLPDISIDVTSTENFLIELLTACEAKVSEHLMLIEYIKYTEVVDDEHEKRKEVDAESDEEDLESIQTAQSYDTLHERVPPPLLDIPRPFMKEMADCPNFLSMPDLKKAVALAFEDTNIDNSPTLTPSPSPSK